MQHCLNDKYNLISVWLKQAAFTHIFSLKLSDANLGNFNDSRLIGFESYYPLKFLQCHFRSHSCMYLLLRQLFDDKPIGVQRLMCVCERRKDIHLQMLMLACLYNIKSYRLAWGYIHLAKGGTIVWRLCPHQTTTLRVSSVFKQPVWVHRWSSKKGRWNGRVVSSKLMLSICCHQVK